MPTSDPTEPQPTITATVQGLRPSDVHAFDLSDDAHEDLVTLRLGTGAVTVGLLGTLTELTAVVDAAASRLETIAAARAGGGE